MVHGMKSLKYFAGLLLSIVASVANAQVFNQFECGGDLSGSGCTWNNQILGVGVVTDAKSSLADKPSVGLACDATCGNLTLSGVQTIDGVLGTAGTTLVLASAQSTASQNGPWIMQTGAWTRPTWYPSGGTTQSFQFITTFVRLGTVYSGSIWRMTTNGAITIDTTSTAWVVTPIAINSNTVNGTIPASIFPTFTGDVSNSGLATTVIQVNGAVVPTSATVLGSNASNQLIAKTLAQLNSFGLALNINEQIFTSSGTWTAPTTGTIQGYEVLCIGGGGGGGGGITTASGTANSGGGGGGGASYFDVRYATISSPQTITIGAGGTAGTAGGSGGQGGTTTFGSLLSCFGGGGGAVGQSAANSGGGGGAGNRASGGNTTGSGGGSAGANSGGSGQSGTFGSLPTGPGGGVGGSGGANGAVGVQGEGSEAFEGGGGGASGGGVSATPGTFAGGNGFNQNGTIVAGGAAGSGGNGGNGNTQSALSTISVGPGGTGGGSAILTFTGGTGGAGTQGGGGGGGGSANSTGAAGPGGGGGGGFLVVFSLF
jgi:hypothetical protein